MSAVSLYTRVNSRQLITSPREQRQRRLLQYWHGEQMALLRRRCPSTLRCWAGCSVRCCGAAVKSVTVLECSVPMHPPHTPSANHCCCCGRPVRPDTRTGPVHAGSLPRTQPRPTDRHRSAEARAVRFGFLFVPTLSLSTPYRETIASRSPPPQKHFSLSSLPPRQTPLLDSPACLPPPFHLVPSPPLSPPFFF
jgi:hypothetical protein